MALQLWEVLKESITVYTGLSPSTFFSVLSLGLAFYYMVSNLFGSSDDGHGSYQERPIKPEEQVKPLPPPVQLGEITDEELKQYDGSDKSKPLLMAIKGQIYDVSQSRMFYGPGGPYALFAGKDASRALAKMSFEKNDLNGDLTGLSAFELEALQDWEYRFVSKYVKVGTVKSSIPVSDGATDGQAAELDSAKATEDGPIESAVPEIVDTISNVDADTISNVDGQAAELDSAKASEDDPVESAVPKIVDTISNVDADKKE